MDNSKKRIVLITGAAGGIGSATVNLFHEKNWLVIGVDRAKFSGVFPDDGVFVQADISDPTQLENIYQNVSKFTDSLDAVINNAAFQVVKPLLETSVEEWDAVMASNLRSVFLGAKLSHPLLKNHGGGAIVNVSSVHAVATSANVGSYAASKGGLLALTRSMAIEFAKDNIRVNAILPGAVDTPMLSAHLDQARLENLALKTVIGRIGKPIELAHAIYFLADEEQSSFMTGQSILVDGGATAKLSTE
ncbi:MAG: NAD(P)-dependent oxidoreductase [Chloroflexi bacterium HGW-Chloroflexi-8]|nr:MAG: NAD(P)-dependent oxidoreductase [Chloroflexi bacterium HGW-Chloroflexi-8]